MGFLSKFNVMVACASALLAVTSCGNDQTSLSIEDIQGKAKIVGSLAYSEGQSYENGQYAELIKPASQKRVFVKVSNGSLDPKGTASGYTTYETMTDENGNYEIEIPAVEKAAGTNIIVQPETFVGTRTLLTGVENGQPKFEQKEVVFEIAERSLVVKPNDIKVEDLTYGFTERNMEEGFPVTVPLNVKVGLGVFKSDYYTNRRVCDFDFRQGTSVMITVTYDGIMENNSAMTRNYAVTTDYNGEAHFNIPAKDKQWSNVNISIKAMPFTVSSFNYYDYYGTQYVINGGVYRQYYGGGIVDAVDTVVDFTGLDGVTAYVEARMVFVPFVGVEDYGYSYNSYDWDMISFD